jgi:hypothetical protein
MPTTGEIQNLPPTTTPRIAKREKEMTKTDKGRLQSPTIGTGVYERQSRMPPCRKKTTGQLSTTRSTRLKRLMVRRSQHAHDKSQHEIDSKPSQHQQPCVVQKRCASGEGVEEDDSIAKGSKASTAVVTSQLPRAPKDGTLTCCSGSGAACNVRAPTCRP